MSLLNTCNMTVFMFWCHKGSGKSACGGEKFFQRGRKMEPGERYFNQYSVPSSVAIHTGACHGGRKTVSFGRDGNYQCGQSTVAHNGKTHVICNKQPVPYRWQHKHTAGNNAIVRLTAADLVFWVKLPETDFQDFLGDTAALAPDIFKERICGTRAKGLGRYKKVKKTLLDKASDGAIRKNQQLHTRCMESLDPGPECDSILKPKPAHSGSSGVKG